MVDEARRCHESAWGLNEAVRCVVVHDLSRAGRVDRDHEEVGEVAVALALDAARAHQADVVVVHGMRRDLHQGLRRRRPRHAACRVGRKYDLGHEDVPRLAALRAWIHVLVLAVPDRVRPSRATGLDPREDVHGIAGPGRAVADLNRRGPAGPTARGARRAYEDLPLTRSVAADAPNEDEVARAVDGEHTSELQSRRDLVCRLLLEKKNTRRKQSVRLPWA